LRGYAIDAKDKGHTKEGVIHSLNFVFKEIADEVFD
jgi:hypothetical protein